MKDIQLISRDHLIGGVRQTLADITMLFKKAVQDGDKDKIKELANQLIGVSFIAEYIVSDALMRNIKAQIQRMEMNA